jgi:TolA-binding protein
MADLLTELDKRVAILETEFQNMEKRVAKMDDIVTENYQGTLAIKERLDKMNGTIPHLADDMKELKADQKELIASLNKNKIEDEKKGAKLNILWMAGVGIVSAGFSILIKYLFP